MAMTRKQYIKQLTQAERSIHGKDVPQKASAGVIDGLCDVIAGQRAVIADKEIVIADKDAVITSKDELIAKTDKILKEQGPFKFTSEQVDAYMSDGGTPFLDNQYTVFGEVVDGMRTIDKIESAGTDTHDRPRKDIRIITMEIVK